MPKKFFDIIPPQKTKSSFEKLEPQEKSRPLCQNLNYDFKLSEEEEYIAKKERKKEKRKSGSKRIFWKSLILVLVFLVIIGITGYSIFSKTEIKISPRMENLNLKEVVTIDSNIEHSDFSAKIISGKVFQDQRAVSQEFSSTGKTLQEEKARGTIRVYNTYSTSSQALLATTRFVSADGKLFRSLKKKVIPGGTYEKGKLVPGYADIEVQAAETGEGYNIGPSTFSIPGFAGTPKYTAFYGKSFTSMTGGFEGEAPQVTLADLEKAKNILADTLRKGSKEFLRNIIPADFVLLDELISQEITKESSSVEAETEASSFNFETEIESEGFAFKKSDIENFAKDLINSKISSDKKFQEESLKINYSLENKNLSLRSGTLISRMLENKEPDKVIVSLEINVKIYPKLDLAELKKAVSGKSFQEVRMFLSDHLQITKIEIKSSPFWRKKIPDDIENIEIVLNLDPSP